MVSQRVYTPLCGLCNLHQRGGGQRTGFCDDWAYAPFCAPSPCAVQGGPGEVFVVSSHRGRTARCAHAVHKVCTGPPPRCRIVVPSASKSLVMHLYVACMLYSFLVYWCVLCCILFYTFVVSIKNLDLDWPLSRWAYGLAPLVYTVISAMASSLHLWSCQDKRNPDCVMRLSHIVGV